MFQRSRLKIALAAIGLLMSASAGAQDYPTKPVTLIVPWPAGGSTDISMRAIADSASKALGQPIVIDNKAGGGGTVGPATMAAAAKSDGYTIAQLPITVFRLPLMQEVSWDPAKDFSYIIHLTGYTFGVTTNAESPFKKWQDVVDYAKQNPGKVTYATPGTRSPEWRASSSHKCRSRAAPKPMPRCSASTPCCRRTLPAGGHLLMPADCVC